MVGDFDWLFSILDLARLSLILGIACLVSMLIIRWIRHRLSPSTLKGWLSSESVATFLFLFLVTMVAYGLPWYQGAEEFQQTGGKVPEALQPSAGDEIQVYWIALIHIFSTALVGTLLCLPLIFIGAYALDVLRRRHFPSWAKWGLGAWVCGMGATVLLMAFPFVVSGMFYLLYWGG